MNTVYPGDAAGVAATLSRKKNVIGGWREREWRLEIVGKETWRQQGTETERESRSVVNGRVKQRERGATCCANDIISVEFRRGAACDLIHFIAVNSVTGYDDDAGTDGGEREVERSGSTEGGKSLDLMPSSNNNTEGSESYEAARSTTVISPMLFAQWPVVVRERDVWVGVFSVYVRERQREM
ncbi:hypothetical protein ACFE04_006061 [Oxalis oulophora]